MGTAGWLIACLACFGAVAHRAIGTQLQYSPYHQQQPQTPSVGAPIAQPIQDPSPQVYQQPQQHYQAYQQPQTIPQDPPARPIAFDCSQRSDGYYAGQQCAKDYVACVAGQAHEFQCPAGLVFDAEIQGCDYTSECGKPRPTTTRAPISFDCRARSDGYHTAGPCTKDYYHCLAGTTFALACPGGTVFDSAIEACDWPETCGQPRAPPPAADPEPVNPYQQVAPPAPPADAIRPVSIDCSQRADGIHVEQPCQNHYWSCANGLAHQFACAPGTLFDPNTQSCEFADACGKAAPAPPPADPIIPAFLESHGGYQFQPQQQQQSYGQQPQQQQQSYGQQVQLPQQSPPSISISIVAPPAPPAPLATTLDCSRQPDGFYEQGHCQQNYVQCANGIAHLQQCQAGLVFRIDRCEFPADCANPPQPLAVAPEAPAQSEPSAEIVTTQTSEASCSSLTDGNHPVADCSQEYSSCWGGAGVRAKCPGSLFYNPENNFCDHRENVAGCNNLAAQEDAPAFSCGAKLPGFYGSGCSGTYFHCDGGISITLACPAGLLFSETTQRCDHRESVNECGGSAPSPIAPSPPVQSEAIIPPAPPAPQQQQYGAAPQQPLQQSPSAYPHQWQSAYAQQQWETVHAQAEPQQPIVSPPQQYSQQGRRRSRARA